MIKTAESVAIGHPDKMCDQIADAILDACLEQDPRTRSAIEVMGGHGIITITGELTTKAYVNMREIALEVYRDCGYDNEIGVQTNVVEQSREIAALANEGAGDQGIMVGYACDETSELMPKEVILARNIARKIGARDGKSQVTTEDGLSKTIIRSVVGKNGWEVGGFEADTGLTGRKLAVDNYGPNIPIGGGAYSGKDATKVDRSGAYMARRVAVDYLRRFGAHEVFVHLAYAIGQAQPVMAVVTIDGVQEEVLGYDLRPQAIIERLGLREPKFRESAKYGHYGNNFTWD